MTKRRYTSTNVVEPPECQELRQILEKFVTPRDVAEALNVNLNTLDLRIHQGAVLHSKAGHATLIPRADIERLRLNHLDRDDIIGKLPEQRQLEKLLQKFVTTKEAAEWLDLAIVTLTQRVTGGRYPHVRIGQLVLVPRSALPAERVKRVKREYSIDGASNLPECQMLNSLLDQFATTEEMAKLAGFSTASLRNSVSQGRTQCIKVGGRILIPRSLLLTMKRDHHSGHAALPEPPEHELLRETLANFVTIREAAKKARLTISTIWSKLERGSLPSVRVGSSILIPRSELKGLRRTNGRTVPSDLPEHKALRKELKKFYTIEEAAKAMGVDIRTIKAARQDGRLPSFKAGSAILIPKSELKHFKNGSTARRGAAADTQECSAMRKILEQFSTITEAAELLGLERTAVYTRIRSGAIPSIKAGTGILIPNSQLFKFKLGHPIDRGDLPEYVSLRDCLKAFTTVQEASKTLGMKAGTLQMAVTTGSVLGVKAGSSLLVPHSEIERLQKGKSVDGQPEPPEYESLREVLKRFVTVQEAAEMLGIKPLNVYVRISQGGILAIRAGTGTLISLTEIERLLAKKHKLPTTAPEPALEVKELQEVLKQFVLGSEAMKILNLKRSTLGSRIKSGHIASISAGETLLIARSELRRVQEAQKPKVYTAPECETLRDALKRFATTQEAAASLGITRSALRQLVLEGQLPYVSTGYEVLIPLSELSKYQQKSA